MESMFSSKQISHSTSGSVVRPIPVVTGTVVNPYQQSTNNNMGIQSQLREGAVKACKKRATKAKYKVHKRLHQTGIQGHAFVPELDCKICVAHSRQKQGIPTRIPKRPHDPRCSKNRKTKGLSVRTVEVQKICEKI